MDIKEIEKRKEEYEMSRKKLEAFALEVLDQCENKGFTLEEVKDLPNYIEEQTRYAVLRHMRNVEFQHIKSQTKES
ncbi:MAG: hypothetical protein CVU95_08465 [Firmicutes bacterium HGW-Firmicutes-2]|jgi:site-specific DNA-cytosine methylase|nr:MAG: hypothetical protein CVU95_08465 [Firmicutes bacterium HGW-Firmicutes-2]